MTRRDRNIGKWFCTFFSMTCTLPLCSQITAKNPGPNHTLRAHYTAKSSFPNLLMGGFSGYNAETFCIFRNYALTVPGLQDIQLTHDLNRWRVSYEFKGSNEWNSQLGMVQHRMQLSKNQWTSVGLGGLYFGGTAQSAGPLGNSGITGSTGLTNCLGFCPVADFQYHVETMNAGRWTGRFRTPFPVPFLAHFPVASAAQSPAVKTDPWDAAKLEQSCFQILWMGAKFRTGSDKPWRHVHPFAQAWMSPQRKFLEVGMMASFKENYSALLALNTTEQPLKWGLYYHQTSWSGGLEGQWLRPLGTYLGWQMRYRWGS